MTQDARNLGSLAARILLDRLEEKKKVNHPQLVELPVTLVERASCGERAGKEGEAARKNH